MFAQRVSPPASGVCSQRSTATGARNLFSNLGAICGLAAVSMLYPLLGSNWAGVAVLAACCLLVPLVVLLWFPETARRSLEDIAPEP